MTCILMPVQFFLNVGLISILSVISKTYLDNSGCPSVFRNLNLVSDMAPLVALITGTKTELMSNCGGRVVGAF